MPHRAIRGVDPILATLGRWVKGVGRSQYWPIRGIMLPVPARHTQQSLPSIWHSHTISLITNSMWRRMTKQKYCQVQGARCQVQI